MLTAAQFQHWCSSLHLSQETCQVLLELRASPPVRRVGSLAGNVSGAYASRKMGCTIQFESHKIELSPRQMTEAGVLRVECPECLTMRALTPQGATVRFPPNDKRKTRTPHRE